MEPRAPCCNTSVFCLFSQDLCSISSECLLLGICLSKTWLYARRHSYSCAQVLICHHYSLLPNVQQTWPTAHHQQHVCRTFFQRQHRLRSHSLSVFDVFSLLVDCMQTFSIVNIKHVPCNALRRPVCRKDQDFLGFVDFKTNF